VRLSPRDENAGILGLAGGLDERAPPVDAGHTAPLVEPGHEEAIRVTNTVPPVCSVAMIAELSRARPMPIESLASSEFRLSRPTLSGSQCQRGAVISSRLEKALRTMR
jgi:hypothetical protein